MDTIDILGTDKIDKKMLGKLLGRFKPDFGPL
jgi:hypothetical protein